MISHIAIPVYNIPDAVDFYCRIGGWTVRRTATSAIINFYGIQLVCHKSTKTAKRPTMYPRHFGIILVDELEHQATYSKFKENQIPFFEEMFTRNKDEFAEHNTFFLKDPSNNVIEFKWYKDPGAIFGEIIQT